MGNDTNAKDYTEMTLDDLNAELDQIVAARKRSGRQPRKLGQRAAQVDRTVPISIRVPSRLLHRLRDEASRRQLPYQRLMLNLVESALEPDEALMVPPVVTLPVNSEALQSGHLMIHVVLDKTRSSD